MPYNILLRMSYDLQLDGVSKFSTGHRWLSLVEYLAVDEATPAQLKEELIGINLKDFRMHGIHHANMPSRPHSIGYLS